MNIIIALIFVNIVVVLVSGLDPGTYNMSFVTPDERLRYFYLHVPLLYNESNTPPMALVFDSHGFNSNSIQQPIFTGYRAVADLETFAVVHPQGVEDSWYATTCCGYALIHQIDDVLFFRMMIDYIAELIHIDRTRVFATGMSNGGLISHILAIQASDVFNAIAPVAATVPYFNPIPNERIVGVYHIHGVDDPLMPIDGNAIFRPVNESMEYWRVNNHCINSVVEITDEIPDVGNTTCTSYVFCPDDSNGQRQLTLCLHSGRHTIPSYTAEKSWQFFKQQPPLLNVTIPAAAPRPGRLIII